MSGLSQDDVEHIRAEIVTRARICESLMDSMRWFHFGHPKILCQTAAEHSARAFELARQLQ